jgi:dTDP-4-dehydrorhamnose 3,5-epimerase
MIEGVLIHPLRKIPDERGVVMHMLRCDDPHFERFGEIYFSVVYPGVVKGWHVHSRMTLNYAVVSGVIKLVLYDDRADSPTRGEVQERSSATPTTCWSASRRRSGTASRASA